MSGDETVAGSGASAVGSTLTPAEQREQLLSMLPPVEFGIVDAETRRNVLDQWTSSAMASQDFRIEHSSYAAAYQQLYDVYTKVRARREAAQQTLASYSWTGVSPSIYGVEGFAGRAHSLAEATVNELIATENQYARILTGMHATYRATKAEDESRAAGFGQIGAPLNPDA